MQHPGIRQQISFSHPFFLTYQHENELKHYFIKYKACIIHFLENAAHSKNGHILASGTLTSVYFLCLEYIHIPFFNVY